MNRVTLTTAMSALRQKLSELFSAQRAPAGYQPGRTLGQLRRNLGLARFEQVSPTLARAALDDDSLSATTRETIRRAQAAVKSGHDEMHVLRRSLEGQHDAIEHAQLGAPRQSCQREQGRRAG